MAGSASAKSAKKRDAQEAFGAAPGLFFFLSVVSGGNHAGALFEWEEEGGGYVAGLGVRV